MEEREAEEFDEVAAKAAVEPARPTRPPGRGRGCEDGDGPGEGEGGCPMALTGHGGGKARLLEARREAEPRPGFGAGGRRHPAGALQLAGPDAACSRRLASFRRRAPSNCRRLHRLRLASGPPGLHPGKDDPHRLPEARREGELRRGARRDPRRPRHRGYHRFGDGGPLLLEPGGLRPAVSEEGGKGGAGEERHSGDRRGGAGVRS